MRRRRVEFAGKGSVTAFKIKTTTCRHDSPLHASSSSHSGSGGGGETAVISSVMVSLVRARAGVASRATRRVLSAHSGRQRPLAALVSRRVRSSASTTRHVRCLLRVLRVPSTISPCTRAASRLRAARALPPQTAAMRTKSATIRTARWREYLCCCRIPHPRAPAHAPGGSGVAQND